MKEAKPKRNHKSSVFTKLFSEKNNLLELYNAVSGKNYPKNTKIEIITLPDVLYGEQVNDIAFTIGNKFVVLIEHQSSINKNMPLRMLLYIAREYELLTKSDDIYSEKRIMIPTPEFIVLYNGKRKFPDYKEMRLSDSFEFQNETRYLELVVKVYNINKGCNIEMAKKSPVLDGYETFIAEIKKKIKKMDLPAAVKTAIKSCIGKNILVSFLKRHGSEVENMLLTEWKHEDALAVRYKEGMEDGIAKGETKGIEKVFALLEKGVPLAEAKRKLGLGRKGK
jgi:predicted transposase/invertase (TIGR01784 family)